MGQISQNWIRATIPYKNSQTNMKASVFTKAEGENQICPLSMTLTHRKIFRDQVSLHRLHTAHCKNTKRRLERCPTTGDKKFHHFQSMREKLKKGKNRTITYKMNVEGRGKSWWIAKDDEKELCNTNQSKPQHFKRKQYEVHRCKIDPKIHFKLRWSWNQNQQKKNVYLIECIEEIPICSCEILMSIIKCRGIYIQTLHTP